MDRAEVEGDGIDVVGSAVDGVESFWGVGYSEGEGQGRNHAREVQVDHSRGERDDGACRVTLAALTVHNFSLHPRAKQSGALSSRGMKVYKRKAHECRAGMRWVGVKIVSTLHRVKQMVKGKRDDNVRGGRWQREID